MTFERRYALLFVDVGDHPDVAGLVARLKAEGVTLPGAAPVPAPVRAFVIEAGEPGTALDGYLDQARMSVTLRVRCGGQLAALRNRVVATFPDDATSKAEFLMLGRALGVDMSSEADDDNEEGPSRG